MVYRRDFLSIPPTNELKMSMWESSQLVDNNFVQRYKKVMIKLTGRRDKTEMRLKSAFKVNHIHLYIVFIHDHS